MGKKNTKRLLISIATLIISLAVYFCSPFLINFNSDKKTGIENLLSELILYQVTIKASIEYLFNVKVIQVNTCHLPRKQKRVGKYIGWKPQYKKAIVRLAEGDVINLFTEN